MKIINGKSFTAERAWGALDIANLEGTTVRLHWTDQPYQWHIILMMVKRFLLF